MPRLSIYDASDGQFYETDIHHNILNKINRYLDSCYNGCDYEIYVNGLKQGELDQDEYEEFRRIFNVHPRKVENNNDEIDSFDVIEYDGEGNEK